MTKHHIIPLQASPHLVIFNGPFFDQEKQVVVTLKNIGAKRLIINVSLNYIVGMYMII